MMIFDPSLRAQRSNPGQRRNAGLLRRFAPRKDVASVLAMLCTVLMGATHTQAADKIHAAKAINVIWAMVPVDIGVDKGFFSKYGVDVEVTTMSGDAKLQQGLIAGSIDIGLAGGSSLVFAAKGSPVIGIAAIAGAPLNFSATVAADSKINSAADLKGTLFSVASNGSFPQWLVRRLSIAQGWGPDGIRTTALGGFEASAAAMETHQVDGFMGATEAGLMLEEQHKGKIVANMGKYVPHLHNHVLMARKELVAQKPDTVERFLKGFFATIAWMKANRDETIKLSSQTMHMSEAVMSKTYDDEIAMMSDDGAFDPQAIDVLKDSYVELGALPTKPATDQLITTQFTPVHP
jgi:NitT/TauT family transport system substrate-binding protein